MLLGAGLVGGALLSSRGSDPPREGEPPQQATEQADAGATPGDSAAPGEAVLDEPPPTAVSEEGGVSATVRAVEVAGDVIAVDLAVVNVSEDEVLLDDEFDPPRLEDGSGGLYPTVAQEVPVGPLTAIDLRMEFRGPPAEGVDRLTLTLNPDGSGSAPTLRLTDVPVAPGRLTFAREPARSVALEEVTAYHPNGVSLSVYTLAVGSDVIEVTLQAVNGNADEVRLADDRPYLQDDRGRRYLEILGGVNGELAIPGRQRLTGTLRFAGPLPADVDDLTLVLNERGSTDYDDSATPTFTVAGLPVPQPAEPEE